MPRAQSDLFQDDAELYSPARETRGVSKDDWKGVYGGAEYSFNVADHVEMGISLDGYSKSIPTVYRDFTRPNGNEVEQELRLTVVPLGVSLRVLPLDRYAAVQPYATIGADVFFYKYEEFGDFIDFADPEFTIRADDFVSEGVRPGLHVTGGLRVRVGHDFSILGEGRYQWAKGTLGDDFSPQPGQDALRLDMSGFSAVVGLSIRF